MAELRAYAGSLGKLHHEIYTSDIMSTPPEKARTILRHPVRKSTISTIKLENGGAGITPLHRHFCHFISIPFSVKQSYFLRLLRALYRKNVPNPRVMVTGQPADRSQTPGIDSAVLIQILLDMKLNDSADDEVASV